VKGHSHITRGSPTLDQKLVYLNYYGSQLNNCMFMSRHQNSRQNHNINTANTSLENVAKLKYLGTTETDINCIREETESTLNSGNACYHLVQFFYLVIFCLNI
jgi:uncharacterized protein YfaP (DUF2135 family)